jgi:hypothetical protein
MNIKSIIFLFKKERERERERGSNLIYLKILSLTKEGLNKSGKFFY